MNTIRDDVKYDLILTPQHYIIKKSELELKYSFQAKNIAPSMLDELSQSADLNYEVFKDGKEWVFIGYDTKEVEELLLSKGLKLEQMGEVYFAQQFKEQLENHTLILDENNSLSTIDGVVTFMPMDFISSEHSLISIDGLKRPKNSFSLKLHTAGGHSRIDTKIAVKISIIMGLFGLGWWMDGIKANVSSENAKDALIEKFSDYPSLQSSIKRKNIYNKYSKIDKKQRAIRDFLKGVGRLVTKDSRVSSLSVESKIAKATVVVKKSQPSFIKNLKKRAKGYGLNIKVKNSNTLTVTKAI
jgi:hypothetical protein